MKTTKVHPKTGSQQTATNTTSPHDNEAGDARHQHISLPHFVRSAQNYHGTTEFWWHFVRVLLAMGIIILQQSSGVCGIV